MSRQLQFLAGLALIILLTACKPANQRAQAAVSSYEQTKASAAQNASDSKALEMVRCAPLSDRPEQLLRRQAYICSFNSKTLLPNWVGWRLTKAHTYGPVKRKDVQFQPDEDVDERCRVTTFDYQRSGLDRGHMCPAGDNRWSQEAMQQCFLMTNICPQDRTLNAGDWEDMESQCREWANKYGEIYIVCGPILSKNTNRRIGRQHRVTVPDGFFKVVLCLKGTPKAIGFIFENTDKSHPRSYYVKTVDQVERATGLDFFPNLADQIERRVEADADLSQW